MKPGSVELFISSLKSESLFWTRNLDEGILSRQSFSQKTTSDRTRKLYPLRSENVTWLSACSMGTVRRRTKGTFDNEIIKAIEALDTAESSFFSHQDPAMVECVIIFLLR